MHWIEHKITLLPCVRPSGVHPVSDDCGEDCDLNYGPIVTKFGT